MAKLRSLRDESRFTILDSRLWAIECNGKRVPPTWVKNLSPHGLCISMGANTSLKQGDPVHVKVVFAGRVLMDVRAHVKWIRPTDTINLNNVGIEFAHPLGTIPQKWREMRLDDHLQRLHA